MFIIKKNGKLLLNRKPSKQAKCSHKGGHLPNNQNINTRDRKKKSKVVDLYHVPLYRINACQFHFQFFLNNESRHDNSFQQSRTKVCYRHDITQFYHFQNSSLGSPPPTKKRPQYKNVTIIRRHHNLHNQGIINTKLIHT